MTLLLGVAQGLHSLTKFCIQKHCDSGDKIVLVCHVIFQDLVIKGPCDFIGRISLIQDTILQSVATIPTLVVEL